MSTVIVDFVAKAQQAGTWALVLVEEGPWLNADIEANLQRLQERLYGCVDAALDGQLSELYPETHGEKVIIRLDGYDLPRAQVGEYFERFSGAVLHLPDYAAALRQSPYIAGIAFELNLEHLKH